MFTPISNQKLEWKWSTYFLQECVNVHDGYSMVVMVYPVPKNLLIKEFQNETQ